MEAGGGDDRSLRLSVRIDAGPAQVRAVPAPDVPEVNIWRDRKGSIAAFLFCSPDGVGICFPEFASYTFPEAEAKQERIHIKIEPMTAVTKPQVIDHLIRAVIPLLLQS